MTVTCQEAELTLDARRAVYWHAQRAVLIADPHFGKAGTFRSAGIPVPGGSTAGMLRRLATLVQDYAAERLLILGDFFHARRGRNHSLHDALARWRKAHRDLRITLVRGNHDRGAGDPPAELGFEVTDSMELDGIQLLHAPPDEPEQGPCPTGRPAVVGHVHPAATLYDSTGAGLRLPCFWLREALLTLPAFGGFTGMKAVRPGARDRVYVIADDEVVCVHAGVTAAQ